MREGSRGDDVFQLQRLLDLPETGEFDAQTDRAVRAFQESRGLPGDGLVGQATWAELLQMEPVSTGMSLLASDITATVDSVTHRGQADQMISGRITVNGHVYQYKSGGNPRGSLPLGDYQVTPHMWERDDSSMSVDGVGFSFALTDKFDPRVGDTRTELRIHPDGNEPGTIGCIGIQGSGKIQKAFREDMRAKFGELGDTLMLKVG